MKRLSRPVKTYLNVFLRYKNREIGPILTQVDSGNTTDSDVVITDDIRKRLDIPFVERMQSSLDTALPGSKLTKLGKTETIKMIIGNSDNAHAVRPLVVHSMADEANIGSHFLAKLSKNCQNVAIKFDQGEPSLVIGKEKEALIQISEENYPEIDSDQQCQKNVIDQKNVAIQINSPNVQRDKSCQAKQTMDNPDKSCQVKQTMNKRDAPGVSSSLIKGSASPVSPQRGRTMQKGNISNTREKVSNMNEYVKASKDVTLKKNTLTFVDVDLVQNKESADQALIQVEPCSTNSKEYHAIAAIYKKKLKKIAILNVGREPIQIRQGEKLANICSIHESKKKDESSITERISKLTVPNYKDLIDQLRIEENSLLKEKPKVKEKLIQLIKKYADVFSKPEDSQIIGCTDLIEFDIKLKEDAVPIAQKLRPLNPKQKQDLKETIENWKKDGIIEPAPNHCEWTSAVVPVLKKTGQIRWCVDYRQLNSMTIADKYPLPNIEENLEALQGSKIYSTLDAASAYHQIPVAPQARPYLAFITPHGLWTFSRMPFGAKNSGPVYSRFVEMVIGKLKSKSVLAYLDDVIVHSAELEDHLQELERVLIAHRDAGIKLRASKTHLLHEEIDYLGFHVTPDGVGMIESYVEKVLNWPVPTSQKELNSFLGFSSYYRSFIKNFSYLTNEMNDAKKKTNSKFEWTETMDKKFKEIKQKFAERPIRAFPDYSSPNPFQLSVDFSAENLGAILTQEQDGQEKLIAVAGRKTTNYEKNYHSTKGELAAVIYGLRKFEHILRFKKFILYTDNSSIVWLRTAKKPRGIIFRWLDLLTSFDFDIKHRPGKENVCADAISRSSHMDHPTREENEEESEYIYRIGEYIESIDLIGDMLDADNDESDHEIDNVESDENLENIKEAQQEDPILKDVRFWVQRNQKPTKQELEGKPLILKHYAQVFELLSLQNDVLYYTKEMSHIQDKPVTRIVLPERKWRAMFHEVHEDIHSGHFGERATCLKAISRFYWPGIWQWTKDQIKKCQYCISKKIKPNLKEVVHCPITTKGFVGEVLYIDLVGPLNPTQDQHRYILTCEDGYSRFVNAIPIKNKEAITVARALYDNYISIFGAPYQIHSDMGTEFTNRIMTELADKWNIKKTTTPAYSPHSNLVERFHRTLNQFFRTIMDREELQWDRYLKAAVLAYNTKIHETTGLTPYYVTFGREAKLPLDIVIPTPNPEGLELHDFVKATQNNFKTMFEYIRRKQQQTIRRNAKYYTGSREKFRVGMLVWYLSPVRLNAKPSKITDQWLGPYTIISKETETVFVICPMTGGRDL